jgi:tRNA (guanine37-N1)-methyltransferase
MSANVDAVPVTIVFITLFGEMMEAALSHSIPDRARQAGAVRWHIVSPRDFATNKHRTVDDTPYGGGAGMVLRAPETIAAIEHARSLAPGAPVVMMTPQGEPFRQKIAFDCAALPGLILLCGRYEGIDERAIAMHVDAELSLGDFVLSGGEPAALAIADAVIRLLPGAVGNASSTIEESFSADRLEHPQFTRPAEVDGEPVPEVLLSGDHARIDRWRAAVAALRTARRRPDLLERVPLTRAEERACNEFRESVPDWMIQRRWWSDRGNGGD